MLSGKSEIIKRYNLQNYKDSIIDFFKDKDLKFLEDLYDTFGFADHLNNYSLDFNFSEYYQTLVDAYCISIGLDDLIMNNKIELDLHKFLLSFHNNNAFLYSQKTLDLENAGLAGMSYTRLFSETLNNKGDVLFCHTEDALDILDKLMNDKRRVEIYKMIFNYLFDYLFYIKEKRLDLYERIQADFNDSI